MKAKERLGVIGGTFDPVHLGHLIAAQDALEAMSLDHVFFMPAWRAPLKDQAPVVPEAKRLSLLEAALEADDQFSSSKIELERGGVSYTIDTALELRVRHPKAELFWIIGSDQATRLAQWHRIRELAGLLAFIVLARPGHESLPGESPDFLRLHFVRAHVFEISSTEIRRRIAEGKRFKAFLPAAVAERIERERLYR